MEINQRKDVQNKERRRTVKNRLITQKAYFQAFLGEKSIFCQLKKQRHILLARV